MCRVHPPRRISEHMTIDVCKPYKTTQNQT